MRMLTAELVDSSGDDREKVLLANGCLEMEAVLAGLLLPFLPLLQHTVDCDQLPLQGRSLSLRTFEFEFDRLAVGGL
jgi:hypothetical protein